MLDYVFDAVGIIRDREKVIAFERLAEHSADRLLKL
jgi:hypothetical protein